MRRVGVMDAATHEKITLRHLADKEASPTPITADEMHSGNGRLRSTAS
jgi:hypothetical protein